MQFVPAALFCIQYSNLFISFVVSAETFDSDFLIISLLRSSDFCNPRFSTPFPAHTLPEFTPDYVHRKPVIHPPIYFSCFQHQFFPMRLLKMRWPSTGLLLILRLHLLSEWIIGLAVQRDSASFNTQAYFYTQFSQSSLSIMTNYSPFDRDRRRLSCFEYI